MGRVFGKLSKSSGCKRRSSTPASRRAAAENGGFTHPWSHTNGRLVAARQGGYVTIDVCQTGYHARTA